MKQINAAIVLALHAVRMLCGKSSRAAPMAKKAQAPRTLLDSTALGASQHIGDRSSQQDFYGASNQSAAGGDGLLALVADGMGGMANGAYVSQALGKKMLKDYAHADPGMDGAQLMLTLLYRANRALVHDPGARGGGTTLAAVLVKNKLLHLISVGDSRIYLMRGGGLLQLNREHAYANQLDMQAAKGEITWQQALHDAQREALTSFAGQMEPQGIDRNARPIPLRKGDRLLLTTDGVYNALTDDEICKCLKIGSAQESADRLKKEVLQKKMPMQDNFTAVVMKI